MSVKSDPVFASTLPDKQRQAVEAGQRLVDAMCRAAKASNVGPFALVSAMMSECAWLVATQAEDKFREDCIVAIETGFRKIVAAYAAAEMKTRGQA